MTSFRIFIFYFYLLGLSGFCSSNSIKFRVLLSVCFFSATKSSVTAQSANVFFFFKYFSFRGEDDYLPGNITEIELPNFMTFNDLKCKPGSRLNLVIGPNGSGKSSLVCAIALGLGGDPQVGEVLILIVSFFKLKLRSVLL